ncbi:hypothetical protein HYG87_10835 [Methanobacterium alkalithermotolerans]|uniref:Uncharacterized protein n=1 Tax=Methanobacterium alkalithermotolerans TaxID=2731220 RepID=A0A8T8K854_9EURY|nr:hypothetical protein [Methanobacterium alkalithermotolerans]QUH24217.1 hypothetical protein HYG87_10835 [Methanobacterium alkalithermotolerans]
MGEQEFLIAEIDSTRYPKLNKALKYIPLDEFNDFSELKDTKLYDFYLELNKTEMKILNVADGSIGNSDPDQVAETMFYNNLMKFILSWNQKFYESLDQSHNLVLSETTKKKLNLCLAYFAAFDSYLSWILEESRFYSIPLILDAISEIEASFVLSSSFYYKQAAHLFRNFLELVVAQYYFSTNTKNFDDWRTLPHVNMPRFRGKDGMITNLRKNGKINNTEEEKLAQLFGTLSAYTHSKYEKLVHIDSKTKKSIPFGYNSRYFEEWMNLGIECMEIGLKILAKHTEDWEKQLEDEEDLLCPKCHEKAFETILEKYGKTEIMLHTCKNCNQQIRTDVLIEK